MADMLGQADEIMSETHKLPTAKWGAACAACATAKAKCIRSNSVPGSKCDRCQRLLKECTGQIHRPRKKRQAKPSRTAQIEERLNGLVNLLQASGELNNSTSPLSALSDAASREHLAIARETPSTTASNTSAPPYSETWKLPDNYNSHAIPACICCPERHDYIPPPPNTDEALLDLFRSQLQPMFPFVLIPSSVTAAELMATKPFLMSAIRMVSSYQSTRSMRAQMNRLMNHIAEYMLIRSAKSLELLQGIVVMIAWHQYHCLMHGQLSNLLGLAMSLVGELALNIPAVVREQAKLMVAKPHEPSGRTNEERRALLGVWFLASNLAVVFNRIEPLRYSPYIQDCLDVLEKAGEYESDSTLSFLVRVTRLTERIAELGSKDRVTEDLSGIPSAPMSAYVAAFQNEINRMRDNLPSHIRNDNVFLSYLNVATIRLYEPPAVDIALVNSLVKSITSGSIGGGTPLDKLHQSSSALRTYFDDWLMIPASSYFRQPCVTTAQAIYSMTMLGRWAQLATPRTMYQGGTPMPAGEGNSAYDADSQMSTTDDALSESSPAQRVSYAETNNAQHCGGDDDLISAVAALQTQLQSQPGLLINIPEILATLCIRCEQANHIFQQAAREEEKQDNNVWNFSALKIRITRVKLERWAENVAAAAAGATGRLAKNEKTPRWRGSYPQISVGGMAPPPASFVNSGFAQDQTQIQNFLDSSLWRSDIYNGVDPTLWFDGYLDWGNMVTSGMFPGEQPQM